MDGMNNQRLTNEAMLAEAKAFQREVSRGKDHRSHGGTSSPRSGAYGSGAHTSGGTPRGVSRQPVAQNLATPEQFFGRQGHSPPAAPPRNPTMPATQQPVSRPVDNYEPMQVDSHPVVPKSHNEAASTTGRGLVGSRWATSNLALKQAPPSMAPPSMAPPMAPPVTTPVAPAYASIDTGRAGATMRPQTFHSSQNTTLDTPEMPKISKGLLGSKWAAGTSPGSPSPMTMKYPDPSTLEPVYRSEDWLSDLSAEYKEMSIKSKNTSENQPTRQTPPTQPAGVQSAAETVKTPTSESQQPGQNLTNLPATSQKTATAQAAAHAVAPKQAPACDSGPSAEFGRTTPSVPATSNQGGVFNDSAFKDWYNSQFMRRKA